MAILSTKDILKKDVVTVEGDTIGSVKDIMLDTERGQIAYAVIAIGNNFLGIGDKLTAVPWNALHYQAKLDNYRLNVEKELLIKADLFTDDAPPNYDDATWQEQTYVFFGVDPYWITFR